MQLRLQAKVSAVLRSWTLVEYACSAACCFCSLLIAPAHRLKQSSVLLPELMQLKLQRCCVGGHALLLLLLCPFCARSATPFGQRRQRLGAINVRCHVRSSMSVNSVSKHTFNKRPNPLVTKRSQRAKLHDRRDNVAFTRSLRPYGSDQGKVTQTTARM
jgi:hypothetical protein